MNADITLGQKIRKIFSFKNRVRTVLLLVLLYLLMAFVLGIYWSFQPKTFDVRELATFRNDKVVAGTAMTATVIHMTELILDKPGGWLSNDVTPPGVWLDNMPNWEYGVLLQIRDVTKVMRGSFSRSQTLSEANAFLEEAEPHFSNHNDAWLFPAPESKYREGVEALKKYHQGLLDTEQPTAQFYARADSLNIWLGEVSNRLGSASQSLRASVGQHRLNVDLAGDQAATQSTPSAPQMLVKTPWLKIDDNFYEARGTAWALVHLLKAAELDFAQVLDKKEARVSLQQIIRELEAAIEPMGSPMILNGDGYGVVANHSLVMASYLSRANAAIIDLRALLDKG